MVDEENAPCLHGSIDEPLIKRIKLAERVYRCYDDKEIYEEKHLTYIKE